MKKKILLALGAIAVAAVLTMNVSICRDSKTGNVDLVGLTTANQAEAECSNHYGFGGGKCLMIGYCVGDPWNNECDFGW
jgi:hypothetical protein